jgi:hypothetical protein
VEKKLKLLGKEKVQEELIFLGKEKAQEGLKYCSWDREGAGGSEIVRKERCKRN